jgi:predicted neuraminidase
MLFLLYFWPLYKKVNSEFYKKREFLITSTPLPVMKASPFYKEEFINPPFPGQVHVASIAESRDRSLFAVWYYGKREGSKDTQIHFSTRAHGEGTKWSTPKSIADRISAGRDLNRYIKHVGNPLIFIDDSDRLWLFYVTVSFGGWSGSSLNVKVSKDLGESWSPSQRLVLSPFLNVSTLVRNNPIPIRDGRFAIPIYHEFIGNFPEILWVKLSPRIDKVLLYSKSRISGGKELIQPSIIAQGPSSALVFFRSWPNNSKIKMSKSLDYGRSWKKPIPLELPNPGSGLNAIRLSKNRILLAFNDDRFVRDKLMLAISELPAKNWRRLVLLENSPGDEFSYPYMIRTQDHMIHLVYTWKRKHIKHIVFNESWLIEKLTERGEKR